MSIELILILQGIHPPPHTQTYDDNTTIYIK